MEFIISRSADSDLKAIHDLYHAVVRHSGGIIRIEREITPSYIRNFLEKSINTGIAFHIPHPDQIGKIVAEIHAYQGGISAFRHILADLTIVVHPEFQGQGLGKRLFLAFLEKIETHFPHILRVELFVREQNRSAIRFYKKMGFVEEGRLKNKILNVDGSLETPIEMTWFNPSFKQG